LQKFFLPPWSAFEPESPPKGCADRWADRAARRRHGKEVREETFAEPHKTDTD
jgi:hypothetical protein